jgi:predicted nuclease of predicted toxin-antitoxin system
MNVLLDECLPRRLKDELPGHHVATVPEMGWAGTKNGALLRLAEATFDVFITADQNVQYQQNLHSVVLGIVVLVAPNTRLETLRPLMGQVAQVLPTIKPGDLRHFSSSTP